MAAGKQIDYQFIALDMCAVLGWSLQQVFSLTFPQFQYISCQLHKLQYQRAKNEVFFGVAAALGGKDNRENLMASAGGFLQETEAGNMSYTQEELAAAMDKLNAIIAAEKEQGNV